MVFKNIFVLVLWWTKVASALEGLRAPLEIVFWINSIFYNYNGIQKDFAKYLEENCLLCSE